MGEIIHMPNSHKPKQPVPKKEKGTRALSLRTRIMGMIFLFTIIIATGISSMGESISIGNILFIAFWLTIFSFAVTHMTKDDRNKKKTGLR